MTEIAEVVSIPRDTAVAAVSSLSLLMHRVGIRDWGKNGLCTQDDIEEVIRGLSQELSKRT